MRILISVPSVGFCSGTRVKEIIQVHIRKLGQQSWTCYRTHSLLLTLSIPWLPLCILENHWQAASTAKSATSCTAARTILLDSVRSRTTATSGIACVLARTRRSTPRPASSRCPTTFCFSWCRSAASNKSRNPPVGVISPLSVTRTTEAVAPCATRYARGESLFKTKRGKKWLTVENGVRTYPPITYYWIVPLILDHSYLVGKLTNSRIADTKVSEFGGSKAFVSAIF